MLRTVRFKRLVALGSMALATTLTMACDGDDETASGTTVGQEEFNPPGSLQSFTYDSKLTLRWTAANVEEDFKGYYVFVTPLAKVTTKPSFPDGVAQTIPLGSGVPYCEKNSKFFEAFGLGATKQDCEGKKDGSTAEKDEKAALAEETSTSTSTDTDKPVKPTSFVKCAGLDGSTVSVPVTSKLGEVECTIDKDSSGTALANGTAYAIFVVGALGDDAADLSWTSNVIVDTPAKLALPKTSIAITDAKMVPIEFDIGTGTVTATVKAEEACSGPCELTGNNELAAAKPTIWLGRDSLYSTQQHRIFLSASKTAATDGWTASFLPRGPQLTTDANGTVTVPGRIDDAAVATTTLYANNMQVAVYNNQVFDLLFIKGTETHYGKLVVGNIGYSSTSTSDAADTSTVEAWIVFQTGNNDPRYFR